MKNNEELNLKFIDQVARFHYLIISLASVLLIIGNKVGWFSLLHDGVQHLLKELGFAGLVAVILIFTLERFSKARHEQETKNQIAKINEDLFKAIFKKRFPPKIISELQNTLFYAKICRLDLELTYGLERMPNPAVFTNSMLAQEMVKCRFSSSYTLENVSDSPVEHPLCTYIELPIVEELQEYCEITSIKVQNQINEPITKGEEKLDGPIKIAPDRAQGKQLTSLEHKTLLRLGPGQRVKVKVEATFVKNLYDTEIWCTMLPTEGCRLTVNVPNGDMKVLASAHNSGSFEIYQELPTTYVWYLNSGMFPHQSVCFWWEPK